MFLPGRPYAYQRMSRPRMQRSTQEFQSRVRHLLSWTGDNARVAKRQFVLYWTDGVQGSNLKQTDDPTLGRFLERLPPPPCLNVHPPSCLRKPAQLPKSPPEGANAHTAVL